MKVKDVLELTIENLGMEGEGVAHADGSTFFVPFALPGERVKVCVDRVKGRVAFAHIIKMLSASPERREAGCPLFGKCGGCALRHLPYQKQLEVKKQNVLALFQKNIGVALSDLEVVGGAEDGYRNKVALPFGMMDGAPVLGMFKKGTHKVLPLTDCPLHGGWITPLIECVLSFAKERGLSVYDEKTGKGLLRHLVARRLPYQGAFVYSVILVVNGNGVKGEGELADRLQSAMDGEVNLYVSKNNLKNNVILSSAVRTVRGEDFIRTDFCGGTWEVSPLSFLQVNYSIAEKIYNEVVDAVPQGAFVVDAYSGTGIMSALVAKNAKQVVGIEVISDATRNANKNAAAFGVGDRVQHLCGEVEAVLPQVVSAQKSYVLIVDPPRAGLDKRVVDTVINNPPERIVYVSCSPATLTRDLRLLINGGYSIESVKLFDMFPQTPHVETLVRLTR